MVALASLPYPIATFITHQVQIRPRTPTVRCSIRVPARRIRRKNYLRPKILKTLTKPHPDPTVEDTGPIVEVHLEPELEKSCAIVVEEELEKLVGGNVGGLEEVEVVRGAVGENAVGFKGVSGRTVVRVAASFVGLFVLQTVVSVWLMGSGDADEKDTGSGFVGLYEKDVGLNGFVRDSGSPVVDVNKVDEIRRMARAVREAERKKKVSENCGEGLDDESDDEDLEADSSIRSGIAEEIEGRLTRLKKRSSLPSLNVTFLNKAGDSGKVAKEGGVIGKEENDRLIFQAKRKFRSQLTKSEDKPKGFQSIAGVKERSGKTDDEQHGMKNVGKKGDIASQRSMPLEATMKSSGINSTELKSGKGSSSSTTLRSVNKLSKGTGTPERGAVLDFSNNNSLAEAAKLKESSPITNQHSPENLNDLKASTAPKMQRRKGQPDPEQLKRKVFGGSDKDKKQTDKSNLWWSTLPYVFVILMTKGHGNEARQGLYTIQIDTDVDCTTSYTVAFEDQNDAKNFSYILDSVFEELLDSSVDVVLMSSKELKEITESLNKKVMVARKGELKLYAGQPLVDVESALISLAK